MCRPKTWQARSVPVRFVSSMSFQSSSAKSSVGARFVRPAELTSMSTRPKASRQAASNASSEARSATSDVTRSVRLPRSSISAAAASTCSARREVGTTSAPASASPCATARPMPDVPPTTTATLPVSSKGAYPIRRLLPRCGLERPAAPPLKRHAGLEDGYLAEAVQLFLRQRLARGDAHDEVEQVFGRALLRGALRDERARVEVY